MFRHIILVINNGANFRSGEIQSPVYTSGVPCDPAPSQVPFHSEGWHYYRSSYLCGSEIYANLLKLLTKIYAGDIYAILVNFNYWGGDSLCAKILYRILIMRTSSPLHKIKSTQKKQLLRYIYGVNQ